MNVVRSIAELRAQTAARRTDGLQVGFVPTMGALHAGHMSLVLRSVATTDLTVVSIFVNPAQFGPVEDFETYPRDEPHDLAQLEDAQVDVAFLPPVDEIYPQGFSTTIDVGPLGRMLEGADRPGHFDGVATVVAKLFNIVEPDIAFFGQKDAQQVAVTERLTRDLDFKVKIESCPTVRDADGVALSSRNAYLSPRQRKHATALFRALKEGEAVLAEGGSPDAAQQAMEEVLTAEPEVDPAYARVVDPRSFGTPRDEGPVLLLVAAKVGKVRLIDNFLVTR